MDSPPEKINDANRGDTNDGERSRKYSVKQRASATPSPSLVLIPPYGIPVCGLPS